jgi:glycosyltransferase involved in cell wall biosynthesis
VETFIKLIAQYIDKDKFEIAVASSVESIKEFCEKNETRFYSLGLSRSVNFFADIKCFFRIRKIIAKEKPAVVHLQTAKAGFIGRIAAKTKSVKILFSPHGGSYLSFSGFKRMAFFSLEVIAKKFTDQLLAISYSEAKRFINEVGFKEENVSTVLNGIPIRPRGTTPSAIFNVDVKYKIGTVSRFAFQKNPLMFAEIANDIIHEFPDVHFYFAGPDFDKNLMSAFEKKMGGYGIAGNLHIVGQVDEAEAENFIENLDIFLLPSVYEGLSLSLLTAMSKGVPCVVSKCEGNMDVINNNENGFACMMKDDYVAVIKKLISEPGCAKEIGMCAKTYVEQRHDITKTIKGIEAVYLSLVS